MSNAKNAINASLASISPEILQAIENRSRQKLRFSTVHERKIEQKISLPKIVKENPPQFAKEYQSELKRNHELRSQQLAIFLKAHQRANNGAC